MSAPVILFALSLATAALFGLCLFLSLRMRRLQRSFSSEFRHGRRYLKLIETSPVGIFTTRADGTFLEINQACAEIFGFSTRKAFLDHYRTAVAIYKDPNTRREFLGKLHKSGEVLNFLYEALDATGQVIWIEMDARVLERHGKEDLIIGGFISNVQERVNAERIQRQNDYRFRNIFEGLESIAVQGYLGDGTTAYWNRGSELLYGYTREEAVGKPLYELIIPPAMREGVRAAMQRMMKTGKPEETGELELMKKNGQLAHVLSHHSLVNIPDVGTELYCIDIDLTERNRAEAELTRLKDSLLVANRNLEELLKSSRELAVKADAANAAKSRFLANMSHEIRTPMNGIIGMTEILLNSDLDPSQLQCARTIHRCGESLVSLISDILDLSAIEAGKVELKKGDFNLEAVIAECEGVIAASPASNPVSFAHEIGPGIPAVLSGDRDRLAQILINLLSNAAKFTVAEDQQVTTRISQTSANGDTISLLCEVEDSGIGIPPERQDELFQPFHQLDASSTRSFEGTGLGLTIVQSLIHLMEGKVGFSSKPGRGSTFWFTLKLDLPQSAAPKNLPASSHSPDAEPVISRREGSFPRVLLVEDNSVNQEVGKLFLERASCEVTLAGNGLEALSLLQSGSYDLCLMDLQMPELDGLAATREIRSGKAGENNRGIPIIALTARALLEDRKACSQAGMNDYIPKPMQWETFNTVLQRWLERSPLSTQPSPGSEMTPETR